MTVPDCGACYHDTRALAVPPGMLHAHPVKQKCGPNGRRWRRTTVARLAERDDWTCQFCREPVVRLPVPGAPDNEPRTGTIEHLWPRSLGGPHAMWNLVLAHAECNWSRKSTLTPVVLDLLVAHVGREALDRMLATLPAEEGGAA
jgi:5-methylcytosine-specific restriction endonuclease McrA